MARHRGSLAAALALSLTAAATTWVAMLSWRGFSVDPQAFLGPLLILGLVVSVGGALARWWRVPGLVVVAAQVVVSAMILSALISGSPIPVGPAWDRFVDAFRLAVETSNAYAAPVPASAPGVHPLLIAGGLGCLLLVDVLACTLRRVPLAGLPLLAAYSVPVSLLGTNLTWWVFALTAVGFMSMLFLHENEQVARWGRPLGDDLDHPAGFAVRSGAIRASAGAIGGVATALAVAVPLIIPTLDVQLFEFGSGPGGGNDISIENPMLDLRRDLRRGEDIPLLRVRSDDPNPSYLRISVLNRYSDEQWSSGDRDVPTDNLPNGPVPGLEGVAASVRRTTYDYDISIGQSFRSTWLPTYAPVSEIQADGDWRYDTATMDFLSSDDDLNAAGESYSMTGVELDLTAADLADAGSSAGLVSTDYLELPDGIDPMVRDLATEVTAGQPTRYQQAVALQDWFRSDGGFTYDDSVQLGNGTDDLVAFLSDDAGGRTGYCEQFAASMAVMARMLGIPARVAVGFLTPDRVGRDLWEYSAYDLHAWPELYIAGAGWVRFEPTPAGRAPEVPSYTAENLPNAQPSVNPSPVAPSQADVPRANTPTQAPTTPEDTADEAGSGSAFPWGRTVGGLGAGAALLVLLGVPRVVRRSRRARRLAGGPEDAWLELRDSVVDLGQVWPEDRSPRETRDHLVGLFGAPRDEYTDDRPRRGPAVAPDAVIAVEAIVRSLELRRYSRDPAAGDRSLRAEVETCLAALDGGATRGAHRRATWWPRSVFRRSTPLLTPPTETEAASYAGVVDHVG